MDETPVEYCRPPLAVLAVRGADARRFLQGQVSADVLGLRPGEARWAGLHNPQGRALAVLQLLADGPDVLALLPAERLEAVLPLLRRYLLRAKATLSDESGDWDIVGVFASPGTLQSRLAAGGADAAVLGAAANPAASRSWALWPRSRGAAAWPTTRDAQCPVERWHRADIADGLPAVHAATAGAFVAQMLNLDLIGGIAFDKGCYTGQEVIARTHYRGRIKRRMQRFMSPTALVADWPPGAQGLLPDGRRFEVVDSVARDTGGCEWLGVTTLDAAAATAPEDAPAASAASTSTPSAPRRCADAIAMPLPYPLSAAGG